MVEIDIADLKWSLADIDLAKDKLFICDIVETLRIEAEVGIQPFDDKVVLTEYRDLLFLGLDDGLNRGQWFLGSYLVAVAVVFRT